MQHMHQVHQLETYRIAQNRTSVAEGGQQFYPGVAEEMHGE